MVNYNVDALTVAQLAGEFDSTDEGVKANTGTPVLLATLTKTDAEWGNLPAWTSAYANAHGITQLALTQIQALYPNKIIDLEGLYVTLTVV
tara:strand:+ start:195 stop:467 length:273 start_codon:yes stop_codon:yes gene_type:complete